MNFLKKIPKKLTAARITSKWHFGRYGLQAKQELQWYITTSLVSLHVKHTKILNENHKGKH